MRLLKASLWNEIQGALCCLYAGMRGAAADGNAEAQPSEASQPEPGGRSFQSVVNKLCATHAPATGDMMMMVLACRSDALPHAALEHVSVQYCFICVLHLCNENGLSLRGSPDMGDFSIVQSSS